MDMEARPSECRADIGANAPDSNLGSPGNDTRPEQSEFAVQGPVHEAVDPTHPTAREAHPRTAERTTQQESDQRHGTSYDICDGISNPTGSALGKKVHGSQYNLRIRQHRQLISIL